ncbi:MAG: hypothetical protein C5B51_18115 [Terriglobia bacterium]|nr:MAG: hypothetical protein C5B51_18115 [Terriglobia bacterium]
MEIDPHWGWSRGRGGFHTDCHARERLKHSCRRSASHNHGVAGNSYIRSSLSWFPGPGSSTSRIFPASFGMISLAYSPVLRHPQMSTKSSVMYILLALCLAGATACNTTRSYIERGNANFAKAKYNDASLNYRKAIQKDDRSGEAYYRLGLTELKLNNPQEAYSDLHRAAELLPGSDDIKIQLGNIALAFYLADKSRPQRLYDEIARISQQLLAKDSNSYDGLRFRGHIAQTDGKIKDAIAIFNQANRVKPLQPDVIIPLVESLFADGQSTEGERLAQELIRQKKDLRLAYDLLYTHYTAQKQAGEGEKVLLTRIQNNPSDAEALLQLGFHYNHFNQRAEMVRTLQRILDNPQTFPHPRLTVGAFYATLPEREEALRQFEQGMNDDPKSKSLYLKGIAGVQSAMGKRDEAIGTLDAVLKMDPKDTEARTSRAAMLLDSAKRSNADLAVRELQSLIKEKPGDPVLDFNLGRGLAATGDLAGSKTSLLKAVSEGPAYLPPILLLADIASRQKNYAETLRYGEQGLIVAPNNGTALYWRGVGLRGLGNYGEARTVFNRILAAEPKFADCELQLGLIDLAEGKFQDAETRFRRIYQNAQDARSMDGLVKAYTAESEPSKAMQFLRAEIQKSPESIAGHFLLAVTASRESQWDTAIEQYQWLAGKDPQAVALQIKLAQAYQSAGKIHDALSTFEKARSLNPADGRVSASIAFLQDKLGQSQEAQANYRRALSLNPENAEILNNLAFLIIETSGNSDEALSLARKARVHAPNNPSLDDTLGWIYLKRNETDAALQVFSNLVLKYPKHSVYRYHLGVAFLKKGDAARGKAELRTALTQDPPREIESKIRELLANRT